jgi:hypothetical protein
VLVTTLPATKQTLQWEKFQSFPEKRKRKRKKERIKHEKTTWESVFQGKYIRCYKQKAKGEIEETQKEKLSFVIAQY